MLLQKIKQEQLRARKEGYTTRAKLLTTLIGEADPYGRGEVSDGDVTKVLIRFVKNIDESIKAYKEHITMVLPSDIAMLESGRDVLNEFLPKVMSKDEMIEWINTNSPQNIGEAMNGIKSYSEEKGMLVDRKAFSSLLRNA